jgi:eukaryotic-like serine/threonine-protein kinase
MHDVVSSLNMYATGQIDGPDLQRLLAHQLSQAPETAPSILAAIAAAERAGKIHANDSRALGDWVRSTTTGLRSGPRTPAQPAGEATVMRAPTRPEGATPPPPGGQISAAPLSEGAVLKDRYLLEKRIGAGGMGVVFRARDLEQQRIGGDENYVAIKVLQPEFREHPDALRSLYEEVRKTRELAHPNIVGVYDCQQDGEHVFMTMQYLEGKTLEVLLDDDFARGMPWERARPIIEGMGSALAYAHDRGVIHCDFKPSNVFITLAGVAKVLDFGIARAVRGGQRRFDPGALGALTPAYASAEMIRSWQQESSAGESAGSGRPDPRDDIFALACVVFELLTGQHPFDRHDAEQARREQRVCPRVPGLSARQNGAIAKAMAFDRERRTARVEEFMRELFSAAPARRSWPWAAATIAAAAIASIAMWGWWQSRGQPQPQPQPQPAVPAPAPPPAAAAQPIPAAPAGTAAQSAAATQSVVAAPAAASPYTVAVEVSGLTGNGLVIQDNGRDNLAIKADGKSAFATPLNSGGAYNVTVLAQPSAQNCTVGKGAGTIADASVTVAVSCSAVAGSGLVAQKRALDVEAGRGREQVAAITPVTLNRPHGLAFYEDRLYVANAGGNQVLVYAEQLDSSSDVTGLRQVATINSPDLRNPARLTFDASGHLYVASRDNNAVSVYDIHRDNREITASAGGALISGASLNHPLGVAVDSLGNVYVANNKADSISIFRPNSPGQLAAGFTEAHFSPLKADHSGNSFAAPALITDVMIGGREFLLVGLGPDNASESVLLYAAPLTARSAPAYVLSNAICSDMPTGATGVAGYAGSHNSTAPVLYISSLVHGNVFRYAAKDFASGAETSCPAAVVGGKGMNYPQGVAVDSAGNVFVANAGSSGDNANTISVYPSNHGLATTDVRPILVYPAPSQRSAGEQQMPGEREEQRVAAADNDGAAAGRPIGSRVKLQADPQSSVQNCPATINVVASVDVRGVLHRRVVYRWLRSDGVKSDLMSADAGENDTVQLSDSWRTGVAGQSITGWEQLEITAPPLLQTNSARFHPRAEFRLQCRPNGPGVGNPPYRPTDASGNGGASTYNPAAPRPPFTPTPSMPGQSPR